MLKEQLIKNLGKEISFRIHEKFIKGKINWVTDNYVNLSLNKSHITLRIDHIKEIK